VSDGKLLHPNERGGRAPPPSWVPVEGVDNGSQAVARAHLRNHRRR
jgi:hypothetical protein